MGGTIRQAKGKESWRWRGWEGDRRVKSDVGEREEGKKNGAKNGLKAIVR